MQDQTKPMEATQTETSSSAPTPTKTKGLSPKVKIYIAIAAFLGITIILTIVAIVVALLYPKTPISINTETNTTGTVTPTSDNVEATDMPLVSPSAEVSGTALPVDAPIVTNSANFSNYDLVIQKDDGIYLYSIGSNTFIKVINDVGEGISQEAFLSGPLNPNELVVIRGNSNGLAKIYRVNVLTRNVSYVTEVNSTIPNYNTFLNVFDSANILLVKSQTNADSGYDENLYLLTNTTLTSLSNLGVNPQRGMDFGTDSLRYIPSQDSNNMIIVPIAVSLDAHLQHRVYVLNKTTKVLSEITNATMPVWKDNNTIVFASTVDHKLYQYNVTTKVSSVLPGVTINMENKYGMSLNGQKITYWTSDQKVYVYDLNTNTETKILDGSTESRWYDSNRIIFSKVEACVDCMSGVGAQNLWVYFVDTASTRLIYDASNLYVSKTDRGQYYCESVACTD